MDKTLSEQMLPTPHIAEAAESVELNPEVEKLYLASVNAEANLIKNGVDPRILPMAGQAIKHAETARENITDPLTGLLNRRGMDLWMERNKPEVFGVIFADGRNFKQYNNISYDAGNAVIEKIGTEIAGKLRITESEEEIKEKRSDPDARDALGIMRFGGDEFMIVVDLSTIDLDKREAILDTIKARLHDFGQYKDAAKGIDLPIQVDAVAKIGYSADNKSLDEYRNELDAELKQVKLVN
ncbi:hypothetical protein H0V99_00260 [Candidatus Saccharibacteria bacterium]|nr:hypothetical protein [Candidatus Saccharibacteria bacterium]